MPAASDRDSVDASKHTGSLGFGTNGFLPPPNTEAGPLGPPQDLSDLSQGIEAWGPVTDSYEVVVRPGVYTTVNRLSSVDPFTASWQLEDGTLVTSNEPLEVIATRSYATDYNLPTTTWTGPDDVELNIYDGRIMVWYKPEVTEADLWDEIAEHNLHVVMSWFEPPDDPELGNAIAWFDFEYDQEEFETFQDAFEHFSADQKVDTLMPDVIDAFRADYAPPNDPLYMGNNYHINTLEVDSIPEITYGPEGGGGSFPNRVIAVIDDGVYRAHQDLNGTSAIKKVTDMGVNCWDKTYEARSGAGEPVFYGPDNTLVDHGTGVAGIITARTNNSIGIASLAPRARVVPFRLKVTSVNEEGNSTCTYSSLVKAIRALRFRFYNGGWTNTVSIVNISRSESGSPFIINGLPFILTTTKSLYYNIERDVICNQRLYVASAGNDNVAKLVIPAAYPNVLGVTGLWYKINPRPNEQHWYASYGGKGSNYWADGQQVYPVSGIFYYIDGQGETLSTPGGVFGLYCPSTGTSSCAPQIAALAFHCYELRTGATRESVIQWIKDSRGSPVGQIAGCVDYSSALGLD